jgi:hypothetical protein
VSVAIPQREAQRLKKRVRLLEEELDGQRRSWASEWPHGVNIATLAIDREAAASVRTARMLKHAVVATVSGNELKLHALRLPKERA